MTEATVERLMARGIKALVVACNTATATSIELLREKYPDFIIVGIEPAVKPAVLQYPQGTVGIMATPVTLRGEKLKKLIAQYPHPDIRMIPGAYNKNDMYLQGYAWNHMGIPTLVIEHEHLRYAPMHSAYNLQLAAEYYGNFIIQTALAKLKMREK